ncbi:MAG: metalloregulator ArsR/SmtB family transcription factor [Candidatus Marinimicrobia bacterium]|nr:metalloregulator ArsR/SmtB family transcription factor [Candidatus Neomarinimicrobiota bacterium]
MKETLEQIKQRFKNNEAACQKAVDNFALISNKTRFRTLCLLTEGDFCVGEIVDTIQTSNFSNISQQLRLLSMAGIVERRRDGKRIIYQLVDEKVRDIITYLHDNYLNA